jgi:antitoxin (DNA-binding transcriptional repressor) of toxin-antitoxin stability system
MQTDWKTNYRVVTARELGRRTAALLDDVENLGLNLLVVRRGLPVAILSPTDSPILRYDPPGDRYSAEDAETHLTEGIELEPLEKEVLQAVTVSCAPDGIAREMRRPFSEIVGTLWELEMKEVITKALHGYVPTRLGRALLRRLQLAANSATGQDS